MRLDILRNISEFIYKKAPKYKNAVRWCFAFLVAVVIIVLYEFDCLQRLELLTVDYRFLLRHPRSGISDIIFIDMEEDSVKAIGRWPWSRKWHATLVKILSEYKPKAIAFDVIFSEPQDEIEDAVFEESIKEAGVVYLPLVYNLEAQESECLKRSGGIISIIEPLPRFLKWAKGTGHLNAIPDSDGILRRASPLVDYKARRTYQFGFKIGCDTLGLNEGEIIFKPRKHEIILKRADAKDITIPLDRDNQLIVNWQAKWGRAFRHFSYIDVISSYALMKDNKAAPIDFDVFRNKICIIGLTASGLIDIKPIPIQKTYPAVGMNAMVIQSVINNDFIKELPRFVDIIIIIFVSVFVTWSLFGLRPLSGILLAVGCMGGLSALSVAAFSLFNILAVTFYPILGVFASYGLTVGYTQLLQSIERMQLFRQATRDGLTHLYNVRHFNLLLESEFKSVSLYKSRPLSIIMSDIDNFKPINDTYGHQTGDVVLREIAKILQSKCRQMDVVARYGGEEFVIMLVGAGEKAAVDVAEKIRAAVENKKFTFRDKSIYTTISIGVVEYSNEKTKENLVEKADKALYRAKQNGKNRVEVYS